MDVQLAHDVNWKNRPATMKRQTVQGLHPGDAPVEAYEIQADHGYTLLLKTPEDPCIGDAWTFTLRKPKTPCEEQKEHEEIIDGKPVLTLRFPEVGLTAYDVNKELHMEGLLDELMLHLSVPHSSGCKSCDSYFLQIDYFGCRSQHSAVLPLVLLHEDW